MPGMTATVPTEDASRLINRLCKHFSHKVDARWDAGEGHLAFSIGYCQLTAGPDALVLACQSPGPDTLEELGQVVASHLVRFAGGEVGAVQWQASEA